ncbi:sulfotransferase [Alcanivorax sp. DP30]|uniref:sulfotransferase n=1 Tax=Alcanivorax sp. DP30 TaxID=2606217 RepID=UPI001367AFFF|nr:sulfotransferase [Alcanivorax sp. DP30]MZR64146.1 hypothetical protein [Alcanivorax sp. DP30]
MTNDSGLRRLIRPVYYYLRSVTDTLRVLFRGKQKVFVLGFNKTGTTTMKKALDDLGYMVGSERAAKPLFKDWKKRDFKPIIAFCKSAEAFQDSPFSFPYTYVALDQAYPGSKFILTVRDDEEQWYRSITQFHSKLWGEGDGTPPTKEQLKTAFNAYKGRPWDVNRALFNSPESDPYDEAALKSFYRWHNHCIKEYFRDRADDLLVINVAKPGAYREFVDFLGVESSADGFPWENKT